MCFYNDMFKLPENIWFVHYDQLGQIARRNLIWINWILLTLSSFPGGAVVKNPSVNAGDAGHSGSILGSQRSSGGGLGNPVPLFLPGKLHGQRSLVGYSPWDGRVRHDWVTEHTHTRVRAYTHTHILIHQFGYLKSRACKIWKHAIFESPIVVDVCVGTPRCYVFEKTSHLKCGGTSELILPIEWMVTPMTG